MAMRFTVAPGLSPSRFSPLKFQRSGDALFHAGGWPLLPPFSLKSEPGSSLFALLSVGPAR